MNALDSNTTALLDRFADLSDRLFELGVIRTDSLIGEIGEFVACQHFNLTRSPRSKEAVDATDENGKKYQIKAKVFRDQNIRFHRDMLSAYGYDYLVLVALDSSFLPSRLIRITQQTASKLSVSTRLSLTSLPYDEVDKSHLRVDSAIISEIGRFGETFGQLIDGEIVRGLNIVGEIGEHLACEQLSLQRATNMNHPGCDAIDRTGKTYEIKTRRVYESGRRESRTRRLNGLVGKGADFLVVVALDRAFRCAGMWRIPLRNLVNPKSAQLGIVKTTPGCEVIVPTSIPWLAF